MIPPVATAEIGAIAEALDAAGPDARLAWIRRLGAREQRALYAACVGRPVRASDLVAGSRITLRHVGRNGLVLFNRFEKRFARLDDQVVGYNHTEFPALLAPVARRVTGPGHFVAYDSPEVPGEVWIDYRTLPEAAAEGFPPLSSNERGLPALVFGDMVDVMRRVSHHVFVGDSFKGRFPRPDRPPFLARVGRWLGTAPFVVCQEPLS